MFDAAVAEFRRTGAAEADVAAIVAAAGVARGTFYFHYPTKEHVLVELEQREEARLARALGRFLGRPHDLASTLAEIARLVTGTERTFGNALFKDLLGLHFRSSSPASAVWSDHPLVVAVVDEFRRAQDRGEMTRDTDAVHHAMFFMLGLYALLAALPGPLSAWADVLDEYLASSLRGLLAR